MVVRAVGDGYDKYINQGHPLPVRRVGRVRGAFVCVMLACWHGGSEGPGGRVSGAGGSVGGSEAGVEGVGSGVGGQAGGVARSRGSGVRGPSPLWAAMGSIARPGLHGWHPVRNGVALAG